MHGGGIRARFGYKGNPSFSALSLSVEDWKEFARRAFRSRDVLRDSVAKLGLRYAYGAAGRAVTLINWAGLDEFLDYAVDGSPLRVGKAIPNTTMPIVSEAAFRKGNLQDHNWCFVTAHNYIESIKSKVRSWSPNMRFVTPLPNVVIQ
jgi:hypothetical protein